MYWPPAIRSFAAPVQRKGGSTAYILITAAAAVFSILYLKLAGVAIIASLVVIGLIVDLWRDAAALDENVKSLAEADRDKQILETQVRDMADRITRLELDNDALREQVQSPVAGLEPLIESLHQQVAGIDLVLGHRALAAAGVDDCPVVRITSLGKGQVVVTGFAGDDADRLATEYMTIVRTSDGELFDSGVVTVAGDREVRLEMDAADMPDEVIDELETVQSVRAEGYVLRLSGLVIDDYSKNEQQLRELRESFMDAMDRMRRELNQARGESADATIDPGE